MPQNTRQVRYREIVSMVNRILTISNQKNILYKELLHRTPKSYPSIVDAAAKIVGKKISVEEDTLQNMWGYCRISNIEARIIVHKNQGREAIRYTVAKELGHVLFDVVVGGSMAFPPSAILGQLLTTGIQFAYKYAPAEMVAESFALELLMPSADKRVAKLLRDHEDNLKKLIHQFGVPTFAMRKRISSAFPFVTI